MSVNYTMRWRKRLILTYCRYSFGILYRYQLSMHNVLLKSQGCSIWAQLELEFRGIFGCWTFHVWVIDFYYPWLIGKHQPFPLSPGSVHSMINRHAMISSLSYSRTGHFIQTLMKTPNTAFEASPPPPQHRHTQTHTHTHTNTHTHTHTHTDIYTQLKIIIWDFLRDDGKKMKQNNSSLITYHN